MADSLEAAQVWIGNHKLKVNPPKTEFILIGEDYLRDSLKLSLYVNLLGVALDEDNALHKHVSNVVECANTISGLSSDSVGFLPMRHE